MRLLGSALVVFSIGPAIVASVASASGIDPFPVPFSSSFHEPSPPLIPNEFKANYMQHKYDATGINHPVAGFAYFSPSQKKIRADGSSSDGVLFSSLFDFGNVSARGEISNRQLLFTGGVKRSQSSCFSDFVVPAEMLFAPDVLNSTQAVFIGMQMDSLYGPLNAWQLLLPNINTVLVTLYLDGNNTLVRQDFSVPGSSSARTFATTRYFNIVHGLVDPVAFDTDCR